MIRIAGYQQNRLGTGHPKPKHVLFALSLSLELVLFPVLLLPVHSR